MPMSLLDSGISRHFALYKGIPGHLILTETELLFNSMKGFRSLSSKLFKNLSGYNTPTEDGEKTTTLFRDFLINIHSVKKEARFEIGIFDTDGLHLQFTSGKVGSSRFVPLVSELRSPVPGRPAGLGSAKG